MSEKEITDQKSNKEEYDKTPAILSYLTLLGFIIAVILHVNKKNEERKFMAFHLRQAFGLLILSIILLIIFSMVSSLVLAFNFGSLQVLNTISFILTGTYILFMIIGVINAINQKLKVLPFFGEKIEQLLKTTFE